MKKIFFILIMLLSISCVRKVEKPAADNKDFLKIPEYTTPSPSPMYTPTYTPSENNGDNSYWFILVEDQDGRTRRNGFFKQEHPYFSYDEAVAEWKKQCKKDVFIISITKVDKETYEHNHE